MKKVIIITGLTASGKSGLAIEIAKKYNGEIISADSVQIYKGLDIGSAKENTGTRAEIKHHLIDIKNFDETYNVGEFVSDTKNAIEDVIARDKLPIIVGGTGLYVKALMDGYSLGGTTANQEFREKYEKMAEKEGNLAVWKELEKLNKERADSVHFNNLKRVIRYLEIENFGETNNTTESILKDYNVCAVGINADRDEIYSKINNRVDDMIKSGLKEEIKGLIDRGANRETQSTTSIGYREWFDHFDGLISEEKTIDLIKQHTRNYCKRQLTFLKTIKGLSIVELSKAREIIEEFLND